AADHARPGAHGRVRGQGRVRVPDGARRRRQQGHDPGPAHARGEGKSRQVPNRILAPRARTHRNERPRLGGGGGDFGDPHWKQGGSESPATRGAGREYRSGVSWQKGRVGVAEAGNIEKHTIAVLVENKFGVLSRVAGLFSRRGNKTR